MFFSYLLYNNCIYTCTYTYKLKPSSRQIAIFEEWLEICRSVYNFALRERKDYINSRSCAINACNLRQEYIIPNDAPKPNYARQCKSLAAAKKEVERLKIPHTHVLQQTLKRLETAFVSMWESGFGFPRFKKSGTMRSFVYPQLNTEPLKPGWVKLPKIGWLRMRMSRSVPENMELKQIRVVRRASGWYAMLTFKADVDIPSPLPHGEPLGIDVGLESYIATSSNKLVPRPKFLSLWQSEIKLLQRQLKHKRKGSSRWKKIKHRIAKLYEKISNSRKDFFYKLSHQLCNEAGMIFAEDLNLKAMSRGMLRKHTLDAAWGEFLNILQWVCFKRNVYFDKVDARGTSQICPACGVNTGKKELNQRVHVCECGYQTNRDVAAAQVVMQRGLSSVGQTRISGATPPSFTRLGNAHQEMLAEGNVVGANTLVLASHTR